MLQPSRVPPWGTTSMGRESPGRRHLGRATRHPQTPGHLWSKAGVFAGRYTPTWWLAPAPLAWRLGWSAVPPRARVTAVPGLRGASGQQPSTVPGLAASRGRRRSLVPQQSLWLGEGSAGKACPLSPTGPAAAREARPQSHCAPPPGCLCSGWPPPPCPHCPVPLLPGVEAPGGWAWELLSRGRGRACHGGSRERRPARRRPSVRASVTAGGAEEVMCAGCPGPSRHHCDVTAARVEGRAGQGMGAHRSCHCVQPQGGEGLGEDRVQPQLPQGCRVQRRGLPVPSPEGFSGPTSPG